MGKIPSRWRQTQYSELVSIVYYLNKLILKYWGLETTASGSILAPWVPTREELIPYIMLLAKPKPGDVMYDLGCGDGRVVVEAALRGAKAVCVELNKELVERAKERARKSGVIDRITFINDDFFKVSLEDATIVYMYLLTSVNRMLKPKLERELRLGTRVITLDFEVPGWRPLHITRVSLGYRDATLYYYVKGISDLHEIK